VLLDWCGQSMVHSSVVDAAQMFDRMPQQRIQFLLGHFSVIRWFKCQKVLLHNMIIQVYSLASLRVTRAFVELIDFWD
jgi:hypothetical protein